MEDLFAYVDQHFDRMIGELQEFCAIRSVADDRLGITGASDWVRNKLLALRADTQVHPIPGGNPLIYGRLAGGVPQTVLFYNHYDVVPEGPIHEWRHIPFRPTVEGDKIYARGVSDNKGGLTSRLHAIETVLAVRGSLPCGVKFLVEGDEEVGSSSMKQFSLLHREEFRNMLDAELSALESRIQETMTSPPPMLQKQKESDGMFAAGTAYGIGGVVPAAASLAHTAQKNAEIRQANAQIDQLNSALVGAVAMANANRMKNARRIKSFRDTFFSKCGYMKIDESSESIFSHLKFSHTEAIVSETGTVTVKTKVTTDGKVTAFGKSAYADGTVIAGIYSAGVKIGEATLVFPILGTGNLNYRQRVFDWDGKDESVELTGICLTCGAVPTLSYTVRFAPGDLWAINRSFL